MNEVVKEKYTWEDLYFKILLKRIAGLDKKFRVGSYEYHEELQIFVRNMRDFITKYKFTNLSKENFLTLCKLVSRYRPVEPSTFLTMVSSKDGWL